MFKRAIGAIAVSYTHLDVYKGQAVTNAISGIIVIGGLLQTTSDITNPMTILAFIAILVATINIVGGFVVTHRMLNMFKK